MKAIATNSCALVRDSSPGEKEGVATNGWRGNKARRRKHANKGELTDEGELCPGFDSRLECATGIQRATHTTKIAIVCVVRPKERVERATEYIHRHH